LFRAPTRKGDPDNPLTDAELEDKYRELATPVMGVTATQTLLETLWRVECVDDLSGLRVMDATSTKPAARGAA